jgi:putative membrane protein
MKNKKLIRWNYGAQLIAALFLGSGLSSCNDSQKPEDTKKVAMEQNENKSNTLEEDSKYLVKAAEINLEEIQLGMLAQKNSSNKDVIALGKMMDAEHTQAMQELKSMAEKKQISIPTALTKDGEDAYNKLSTKNGKDFDKDYCDMMVDGHEKAIKKFEEASKDAKDAEIRTWASNMLPTLNNHLEHSKRCKEKCSSMK